jgi:integrase
MDKLDRTKTMSSDTDTESVIPGIYKRNGTYGFRVNIPDGKGKQKRVGGFATQEAAYKARIRYLGGASVSNAQTVAGWFEEFLDAKSSETRETTVSGYAYCLGVITPYIGDYGLQELSETHLREAYKNLVDDYSTGTIQTIHWRIRTALRQAVRETRVTRCVADNVKAPKGKPTRKRRVWSFDQLMIFAKYTSTQRDAAAWAVYMTTGLRRGEVGGLKWPKVNLDEGRAIIDWQRTRTSKGKVVEGPVKTEDGERVVPLSPRVVSALRTWRADQSKLRLELGDRWLGGNYVFTSIKNEPYHPDSFNDRLKFLCEKAELPQISPHELRHTYATRALESGMAVEVLSKLLGHSRIEVTQNLYIHPSESQGREANDALVDRMFG